MMMKDDDGNFLVFAFSGPVAYTYTQKKNWAISFHQSSSAEVCKKFYFGEGTLLIATLFVELLNTVGVSCKRKIEAWLSAFSQP